MDTIDQSCFRELSPAEKARLGISSGIQFVYCSFAGGLRWNYNIGKGFVITVADHQPVRKLRDLLKLLHSQKSFSISGVYPDGTHQQYFIE